MNIGDGYLYKDGLSWAFARPGCFVSRRIVMKYIESPEKYLPRSTEKSIFLAGGITGCPNWQQEFVDMLRHTNLAILNPRRKNFPINDPNVSKQQIAWEYDHLKIADQIIFWFPFESICPIALFELGAWLKADKPIFIGVHPNYKRRIDIEEQMRLERPDISIIYSLSELAQQIIIWNGMNT